MNKPAITGPNRLSIWLVAIAGLAFLALGVWIVLPPAPSGFNWDDTWYLWMAEWFTGRPDYLQFAVYMLETRQYPPLFPYVLSLTGDVLADTTGAMLMNLGFLAGGAVVTMLWLQREGLPIIAAMAGGALVMFNPVALSFMPVLLSEPLFILLTAAVLLRASTTSASFRMWLLTGVLTGLAIATRSAGWALALGVLMALALQARLKPMSGWLPGLVLGLLVIPYLTAGLPEARGYVDLYRDVLGSIDPAFLLGQSKVLVLGWVEIWGSVAGAMMAALLVLPGWVTRLLARRVDAWYMAISIGMLLFWPFPDHMARLLVVLVPVFVVSAHAGLELMLQRAPGKGAVNAALAALFLMTLPSGLGLTMARLAEPLEDHLSPLSRMPDWTRAADAEEGRIRLEVRRQILLDMERISGALEDRYCIYSELPAVVSIQTRRIAYASTWASLDDIYWEPLVCPYYYLVTDAVGGLSDADLERFVSDHREVFRSAAPFDPDRSRPLAVFVQLNERASD